MSNPHTIKAWDDKAKEEYDERVCDVTVRIELIHESGQWMRGSCTLLDVPATSHGIGGAGTYAERYCLRALFAVATEDDDGNAARARKPDQQRPPSKPQPVKRDEPRKPVENSRFEAAPLPQKEAERLERLERGREALAEAEDAADLGGNPEEIRHPGPVYERPTKAQNDELRGLCVALKMNGAVIAAEVKKLVGKTIADMNSADAAHVIKKLSERLPTKPEAVS